MPATTGPAVGGEMSLQEKARVLRLMVTIMGRSIGWKSLLPAAKTNECRSLIAMGARPVMGLDECPIFTRLQAVWHHLMQLKAYGEERLARERRHITQSNKPGRSALRRQATHCNPNGHHYAADFYAKPVLIPGRNEANNSRY